MPPPAEPCKLARPSLTRQLTRTFVLDSAIPSCPRSSSVKKLVSLLLSRLLWAHQSSAYMIDCFHATTRSISNRADERLAWFLKAPVAEPVHVQAVRKTTGTCRTRGVQRMQPRRSNVLALRARGGRRALVLGSHRTARRRRSCPP